MVDESGNIVLVPVTTLDTEDDNLEFYSYELAVAWMYVRAVS